MDDFDTLTPRATPTPDRPLAGLTILVVEDSHFASEAMRLLCLRSGARIRRADCLRSARRHLRVYRPAVVIVDMSLPDGSGEELIGELAGVAPRTTVILGTSGDIAAEGAALAAGADGFLPKPVDRLADFQTTILSLLPDDLHPGTDAAAVAATITPDPLAYRDDLAQVAETLSPGVDATTLDFLARFLAGVARSAHDSALEDAARALRYRNSGRQPSPLDIARLKGLVRERLAVGDAI